MRYKKNCHFFPIVSSAALWLPSHECPGYYKSHAHMSSASMVSCLLSECYLVLSVPIIFKLALDRFQKLQCYSWKLRWRLSSLLEQGAGAVLGLAGEGVGIGAQGVGVCVCQFSAWEPAWEEFCVMSKMWSTDMWREGNCSPRRQSPGELPARLSPSLLWLLTNYHQVCFSKQINRAETWNVSLSGSKQNFHKL